MEHGFVNPDLMALPGGKTALRSSTGLPHVFTKQDDIAYQMDPSEGVVKTAKRLRVIFSS